VIVGLCGVQNVLNKDTCTRAMCYRLPRHNRGRGHLYIGKAGVPNGHVRALQRQNAENLKQIFPEKEYRRLTPNFHIHVSVSDLYIPTMGLPVLLEELCRLILGIYKSVKDT
jgi:hypothetical protein